MFSGNYKNNNDMDKSDNSQKNKAESRNPIFAYYRELRPYYFSDTKVVYEVPLTEELFDVQMDLLSTKKRHSEFERFVIAVASRLLTPNIKPQTGPDGGGDGKVDAETYEVSDDISDKWYSEEQSASGKEKWAFAISCKKTWRTKIDSDIKKIHETGRGYTKALFFTNQYVKSSTRIEKEEALSALYGISVSIYDRSWLQMAVFLHGCLDMALDKLCFSEQYKRRSIYEGPNDKERRERLKQLESSFLRHVEGLNTDYIDDLKESCILSRELELPRVETEGRFRRAMDECKKHGTEQQLFVLIYEHGWTSFFWFEDIDACYRDYLTLKEYVERSVNIARIEKLTNLLTNLSNAVNAGCFDQEKVHVEVDFIKSLSKKLHECGEKPSCGLYIDLYIAEQKLISHMIKQESIEDDIHLLKPLLLEATSHIDISFESQYHIIDMLSKQVDDCPEFDELVDELAETIANTRSAVEAARVKFARGQAHLDKKNWKEAIKKLSFCVYAFEKEECMEEMVKSSGYMGMALWNLQLPYSAEAFLLKSAAVLLKKFYSEGQIPHLLITVLSKLCEIELMTGRLAMYWNYYELVSVLAHNAQFNEEKEYVQRIQIEDAAWACRLADADLSDSRYWKLPDIFDRLGMYVCSETLKLLLGHENEVEESCKEALEIDGLRQKLQEQPVFEQFLGETVLSTNGVVALQTTVDNFTIKVIYENSLENQQVAEIFLASIESFFSTADMFDVVAIDNVIIVTMRHVEQGKSELKPTGKSREYELLINPSTFDDQNFWECISMFLVNMLLKNAMTKEGVGVMVVKKHSGERLMDRVSVLLHTKFAIDGVLGKKYKYRIDDWEKETDKVYEFKGESLEKKLRNYKPKEQQSMPVYKTNDDMSLWDDAGWMGCGFIMDYTGERPAIFGLAFKNLERGNQIVLEWGKNIVEGKPSVKIFIIKGIDQKHPTHYRVCISPVLPEIKNDEMRYMATVCRKHTVTPNTDENLSRFEERYNKFRGCWLQAMQISDDYQLIMPDNFKSAFRYTDVVFVNAYEISEQDEAKMAIEPNDDPFIPENKRDSAPIIEVLENMKHISCNK